MACTIVNILIAVAISIIIGAKSKIVGTMSFLTFLACVYLRGYLVPKTPTLTKRYLPSRILSIFDKGPEQASISSGLGFDTSEDQSDSSDNSKLDEAGRAVETYLLNLGAIEPCDNTNDLCLTENASNYWSNGVETLDKDSVSADEIANTLGISQENSEFTIKMQDDAYILYQDDRVIGQWPSKAALVADLGAVPALRKLDPEWDSHSIEHKGSVLNGFRLFLEECPQNGGDVEFNEEIVESCCQSHDVLAVTCSNTDERLFEILLDDIETFPS